MRFMNTKTGSIITAKNKTALELIKASDRYIPVKDKAAKSDKPTKLEKTEKTD